MDKFFKEPSCMCFVCWLRMSHTACDSCRLLVLLTHWEIFTSQNDLIDKCVSASWICVVHFSWMKVHYIRQYSFFSDYHRGDDTSWLSICLISSLMLINSVVSRLRNDHSCLVDIVTQNQELNLETTVKSIPILERDEHGDKIMIVLFWCRGPFVEQEKKLLVLIVLCPPQIKCP